jgi:hypothetical protein
MKRLRSSLTYSNVVSTLCLFLLLGGGAAYAATHLGKNSVGTKQLKNNSVTTAKIKDQAVRGSKINLSSLGTVPSAANASNASNAAALGGTPPSGFAASTTVRSAAFNADGTVDLARSDGVSQANVSHPGTGFYCIDGLSPAPHTAITQVSFGSGFHVEVFVKTNPGALQVCEGKQIGILVTENESPANKAFEVIIH